MPWRWGLRIGAFVPRSHMLHLLTRGTSCVCCFLSTRRPPLLLYPRRSSLLIAPPFYTIGGAISFCLLIIPLCPFLPACPVGGCHYHLTARASCVFCRFHMGPFACPSRRTSSALPLHDTPLVISSFQSPRSSPRPTGSHRHSPRSPTRLAGRAACFPMRCLSCPHAVI